MAEIDPKKSSILKLEKLTNMLPDLSRIEQSLFEKGYQYIAGVDEAGRGPLAGPVVAAAVILPIGIEIDGLDDSKKLSAKRRDILFDEIAASGAFCEVGIIDNDTIDKINILQASLMAMRKAVNSLKQKPEIILVDGTFTIPNVTIPQMAIVGGDRLCKAVSAASIIAKVTRDRIMDKYAELHPNFSFAQHKGYPTKLHLEELAEFGATDIHRQSYKPVIELTKQTLI
ncbi:MAG: ribonuclease HII [Candidatus Zixiibacteriota bacterium]